MILLLLACAGTTPDTGADACAEEPSVSWESFGAGFVTENCQVCHASTAPDRHDAPAEVTFDNAAEVWALRDEVLATAAGESPTMPPQGGVAEDDRHKLEVWLRCGIDGE